MKKLRMTLLIFMCLSIVMLSGCGDQQDNANQEKSSSAESDHVLENLALSADTSQIYNINDTVDISITTSPKDLEVPESAFHTSGGTLECDGNKATFTSTVAGKFEIYAEYSDFTNNKITLKFENQEADRIAAEQAEAKRVAAEQAEAERITAEQAEAERITAEQAEAERITAEQAEAERIAAEQAEAERIAAEQAEAARIAAEQAEAERIAAEQAEAARIAQEQTAQQQNIGQMVWISATGSKYHSIPNCGRMNPANAYQMSVSDAQASGYGACSKCF